MVTRFMFLALTYMLVDHAESIRPIIFMHGIIAAPDEADPLKGFVEEAFPGTNVTAINAFNHLQSVVPMWTQVNTIKEMVRDAMVNNPEGVNLICFSQGGLICRGLLSVLPHNVNNFISVSSPQAGQYGDTMYLQYFFPNYLKQNVYKFFYSDVGQQWSIANYWHDPHQEALYTQYNKFLAALDNDTATPNATQYKNNFLRLKKLIMIGGPDDGVITPWQSSHFGFYDGNETVVPMKNQKFYEQDSFGLKTLDTRGDVVTHIVPGVQHTHWMKTRMVFEKFIKPWLTG
ncbi:lysosomal thioesterase PPT2-A-like isoform X2 [Pecten maximus]|uniref:lysosomal thioesterase PPT2-A-like isoform X2 n=1 Tax=Pecten maximus TaxID=6579 RepID=UPI0014590C26|nr:lysosomal thioesterase PPT2-A-like isoform X2 [Pecten maximus]